MTREEFEKAAQDFAKSKSIRQQADALEKDARKRVLAYVDEHPEEFAPAADSETGRTVEPVTPVPGVRTCRVTTPMAQEKPARFDDSRTEEAVAMITDAAPELVEHLFETTVAHRFRGPEAVLAAASNDPTLAPLMARLLVPFTLPAEPAQALSPRLDMKA